MDDYWIYILLIILLILVIVWFIFGGKEYEFEGLKFLDPPINDSSSYTVIEENSTICTIEKKIPYTLKTLDLDFYLNLPNMENDTKRYEKKTVKESKGESICRKVFEYHYGVSFPTIRPDFLINPETGSNIELDGYNEELKLAFEYNGIQHYVYPNKFHKNYDEFEQQIRRDIYKKEACKRSGVYLLVIPYEVPEYDIPKFIEYWLPDNIKYRRDNNIDD